MNPIEAKIEALIKQIDQRKQKAASSARLTAVVYGVLVIFVFGYTLFIANALEKSATPDNISAMLRDQVSSAIPGLHEKLVAYVDNQTPVVTEKVIQMGHDYIPQIEDKVKETIDGQVDYLIKEIRKDLVPQLLEVIDSHAKDLNEQAEELNNPEKVKELSQCIIKEIDDRINYELIGDEFFGKFHELRKSLDDLASTPPDKMTRKQMAERQLIVNWLYLIKTGDSLHGIVEVFVRDIGFTFNSLMDGSFFISPPPTDPLDVKVE